MSRTYHQRPWTIHRNMSHMNQRKMEMNVLDQLTEEALLNGLARNINRIKAWKHRIPNPWDDYMHSSGHEYHNRQYWRNWFKVRDLPHYVKNSHNND